jgi:DNA-binding NtrC family response regulator
MQNVLQAALGLCGYQVVTVSSGPAARQVRQCLDFAALGLVIVDTRTPDILQERTDQEFYQQWQAMYPELPFLLLSESEPGEIPPTSLADTVCVLTMPVATDVLLDVIWELLRSAKSAFFLPIHSPALHTAQALFGC